MSQHPKVAFAKTLEAANRSAYAFLGFMNDSQLPDEISMTGKMNGHDFDLQLDCRGPLDFLLALLRYLEIINCIQLDVLFLSSSWETSSKKKQQTNKAAVDFLSKKTNWKAEKKNMEQLRKLPVIRSNGSTLHALAVAGSSVGCPKLQGQVAHFSDNKKPWPGMKSVRFPGPK